jgi:two-component system response regulator RstA
MSNSTPKREKIVLVEDDDGLAGLIKERLEAEGFAVLHSANGIEGRDLILAQSPDLVLLDIMLPGMDGFQVCREVRPAFKGPMIILTASDDDYDEILGLEMGADDYVTKPVKPRILLARIRALLRRAVPSPEETTRIRLGKLIADAKRREVTIDETPVELTTIEFDLLWYLITRTGQVVSRQDLYRKIYNLDYDGLDRSIDVYISRLRQKLGDDSAIPHYIKTVRGVGYLLVGEKV